MWSLMAEIFRRYLFSIKDCIELHKMDLKALRVKYKNLFAVLFLIYDKNNPMKIIFMSLR